MTKYEAIQRYGLAMFELGSLEKGTADYRDAMEEMIAAFIALVHLLDEKP